MTFFAKSQDEAVYLHPNQGQWNSNILYNVDLPNGHFILDKEGYTISMRSFSHQHTLDERIHEEENMTNLGLKIRYLNSNKSTSFEESMPSEFYRNYFLGNDKSKWQSEVHSFKSVVRKNVYTGIDVQTIGKNGALEMIYFVNPNANAEQIQLQYDGFSSIELLKDGALQANHLLGFINESKPIAWNVDASGNKIEVPIHFRVNKNVVSFEFPKGYNTALPLVIDPVLAFSTFTGATSDNWGFTAAPDPQGNAFGGGVSFNVGYPTTTGVLDNSFNGGNVDVGISKFSTDGSQLLYSTYIGGSNSETPHSIISNAAGEIYVFGVTGSSNFPVTTNTFQTTFKGGSSTTVNSLKFTQGSDIYVLKLNATGTSLLASTFVGGTANDGVNLSALNYNYGDQFRGDITLDNAGNVFVASTTYSNDFPIFGTSSISGGGQDAVVFKMNGTLTSILWSSYWGGTGNDAAYSIQVANDNSIYIAGGTTSTDHAFSTGIKPTTNGGTDGYITKFSPTGNVLKGTYVGTSNYDQVYFLQLDLNQNVYVFGQTLGAMTVSPGKYGQANSGQFIKKFDNTLSNELWTTLIGSNIKRIDISPTAFLVSDCFDIYLAGWGGSVNQNNSQAIHSSTTNLPVTSDAYQATTNGSNFYIAVLKPDATGLKYGTFIGGVNSSANHVDGGTSRFDKGGKIYHAVCAACGGNANGFTTTPGVYAPHNKSTNCNMAVFKFEISFVQTNITNINPVICYPNAINFNNVTVSNGTGTYYWDFGDGTTSSLLNPTHTYASGGNYTVSFVVKDPANCYVSDTVKFNVVVKDFNASIVSPNDTVCPNVPKQLHVQGGSSYQWSPVGFLDNPTSATPKAIVDTTTDFMVIVKDNDCGIDTAYVRVNVYNDSIAITKDTTVCKGSLVALSAHGAVQYTWSPTIGLNNATIPNPTATVNNDVTYVVTGVSVNGCPLKATTSIKSILPPQPIMPDSVVVCSGAPTVVSVSGASTYTWSPNISISTTQGNTVTLTPSNSRYYYCEFTNACGTVRDSVYAAAIKTVVTAWNDTIICPGESAILFASGAKKYTWSPSTKYVEADGSIVTANPTSTTTYVVVGTDAFGCKATATVKVMVYPKPIVQTIPDVYGYYDDSVTLGIVNTQPGVYIWSPPEYLSCTDCTHPTAMPNTDMTYTVTYIDENGCKATDIIKVIYEPLLYIPNAFTPDGNGTNDVFRVYGTNIDGITVDIYNRWGELIHTIHGMNEFWDGTYKGLKCPIGTYVWKIEYTDIVKDVILSKTGHVNLLR